MRRATTFGVAALLMLLTAAFTHALAAEPARSYSVQVGSFPSPRKAAFVHSIVRNLGEARVEKTMPEQEWPLYRVLVGSFKDINAAEAFIREHRLKKLFPDLWINPVSIDVPPPLGPPKPLSKAELETDPYHLTVNLHCGPDQRAGREDFFFRPEEKGAGNDLSVALNWSCSPRPAPEMSWTEKDTERNPSQLALAPLIAFGSLSTTDSTAGSPSASDFAYGAQLSALKNFDGVGAWIEYRLLNHRYSGEPSFPSPVFVLEHRALVGARLPLSGRFELSPEFGYGTRNFLFGSSPTDLDFESVFAPRLGLRARYMLFELSERASIDLAASYSTLLASRTGSVDASMGSSFSVALRARHFFPSGWGADWFTEFSSTAQKTSRSDQSESKLLIGISFIRGER